VNAENNTYWHVGYWCPITGGWRMWHASKRISRAAADEQAAELAKQYPLGVWKAWKPGEAPKPYAAPWKTCNCRNCRGE